MVVGQDGRGATPPGNQEGVRASPISLGDIAPSFRSGRSDTSEGPGRYKVQPLPLFEAAATSAAAAIDFPENRQGTREDELLRLSRLALQFAPRPGERKGGTASAAASASARARTLNFKDLLLEGQVEIATVKEGQRRLTRPSPRSAGVNGWRIIR